MWAAGSRDLGILSSIGVLGVGQLGFVSEVDGQVVKLGLWLGFWMVTWLLGFWELVVGFD